MKAKLLAMILVIMLAIGAIIYDMQTQPENISYSNKISNITNINPTPAPDIVVTTADGRNVSIHDMKEDIILLNFWASWCASCKEELPKLIELLEKYKGKIAIVAISIDDKKQQMLRFQEKLLKTHKDDTNMDNMYFLWDKDKKISLQIFNTIKVPETIILDKKRMMVKKIVGVIDWHNDKTKLMMSNIIESHDK